MNEASKSCEVYSKANLDDAAQEGRSVIVIKDSKLGNKTVLWLRLGKYLNRLSIAVAAGAIISSTDTHHGITNYGKPLAIGCTFMNLGFHLLWFPNPLTMYRVSQGPSLLTLIRGDHHLSTVLVKQEESFCSFCSTIMCVAAVVAAFWGDIKAFNIKKAFNKMKSIPEDNNNKESK